MTSNSNNEPLEDEHVFQSFFFELARISIFTTAFRVIFKPVEFSQIYKNNIHHVKPTPIPFLLAWVSVSCVLFSLSGLPGANLSIGDIINKIKVSDTAANHLTYNEMKQFIEVLDLPLSAVKDEDVLYEGDETGFKEAKLYLEIIELRKFMGKLSTITENTIGTRSLTKIIEILDNKKQYEIAHKLRKIALPYKKQVYLVTTLKQVLISLVLLGYARFASFCLYPDDEEESFLTRDILTYFLSMGYFVYISASIISYFLCDGNPEKFDQFNMFLLGVFGIYIYVAICRITKRGFTITFLALCIPSVIAYYFLLYFSSQIEQMGYIFRQLIS